jgi:hypothetical protein
MITARSYRTNYSIISLPGLPRSGVKDCLMLRGLQEVLKKKGDRRPPVITWA